MHHDHANTIVVAHLTITLTRAHVVYVVIYYLRLGHACLLHAFTSSPGPRCEQSFPLPFGGGLVQVLSRILEPPPQLLLHVVH